MALQYRDALAKKNYEEGLRQKADILSRIEKLKLISTSGPQLLTEQKNLFNVNQNLKKFAPVETDTNSLTLWKVEKTKDYRTRNDPQTGEKVERDWKNTYLDWVIQPKYWTTTLTEEQIKARGKPFKENKDNINASPYWWLEVSQGTTQKKSDGTIVKQEGWKSSPSIPSWWSTKTSAKSFNTQSTNSISWLLWAINETRRQINEGTDKLIGEANTQASKSLTTLRNDNQWVKRWLLLDAWQRTAVLQWNATRAGLSAQSAVWQVAQVNSDVYTKTTEQDSLTDQKAQATMTNLQNYITQLESNRNNGNVNVNNQLQQAQALYAQLVQQFGDGATKTSSTTTSSPTTGSSSWSSSSSSWLINKIKQAQKTGSNNTPTVTTPKTTPEKPFVSWFTPAPGYELKNW